MSTQITITCSPEHAPVAYAEGLILMALPMPKKGSVKLIINSSLEDYQASNVNSAGDVEGNLQIAQLVELKDTDETFTINFAEDFREQKFAYGGKYYSVKFMDTTTERFEGQNFPAFSFFIETLELTDVQKTGTLVTSASMPHSDWMINKNGYNLPSVETESLLMEAHKNPEGVFVVKLNGPLGHSVILRYDLNNFPEGKRKEAAKKCHLVAIWSDGVVKLYLNAELIIEHDVNN